MEVSYRKISNFVGEITGARLMRDIKAAINAAINAGSFQNQIYLKLQAKILIYSKIKKIKISMVSTAC